MGSEMCIRDRNWTERRALSAQDSTFVNGADAHAIIDPLRPLPSELVVNKTTGGAFNSTTLHSPPILPPRQSGEGDEVVLGTLPFAERTSELQSVSQPVSEVSCSVSRTVRFDSDRAKQLTVSAADLTPDQEFPDPIGVKIGVSQRRRPGLYGTAVRNLNLILR